LRLERLRDPRSTRRIEAIGQLSPGSFRALFVSRGEPGLCPEALSPLHLFVGQRGFVRVDVHLVGIHAHSQLERSIGLRKKARFETHWE
jgi:hypothetical protein